MRIVSKYFYADYGEFYLPVNFTGLIIVNGFVNTNVGSIITNAFVNLDNRIQLVLTENGHRAETKSSIRLMISSYSEASFNILPSERYIKTLMHDNNLIHIFETFIHD